MFDTHCHLNFKAFHTTLPEVLFESRKAGVDLMLLPGTDVATSRKAIEIAEHEDGLYVAAGIHPHHVFEIYVKLGEDVSNMEMVVNEEVSELRQLLKLPKVVAVGEVGLDRHMYVKTKYQEYTVSDAFVAVQVEVLKSQIQLALDFDKSLVLHNREADVDMLRVLSENWDSKLEGRTVFHCCEASNKLLAFARENKMYIGVDGDITYGDEKKEFIKKVPHEMLVIETDSPYLLPEELRIQKKYPNIPANLPLIAEVVGKVWGKSAEYVGRITKENGKRLFKID